ncbi:MAG: hypothetical protein ACTSO7_14945, partial [Candidatus Heimdallarchaeota archaeon]
QLLKANYKAFLATELFAFLSAILIIALLNGIIILIYVLSPSLSLEDFRNRILEDPEIQFSIIGTIFLALIHALLVGFLYCQYGLSYDIMSSGDLFSEFRRAFSYFRKYWWQYILLSFLSGFSLFLPIGRAIFNRPHPIENIFFDIGLITLRYLLLFLLIIFSSSILPSLTAQGRLKNSFIEANRLLKKAPKRIIKTWSRFYLLFLIPLMLLNITTYSLHTLLGRNPWVIVINVMFLVGYLVYLFIAIPWSTLIATRIYNSVDIERFKPLTEEDNENTTEENKIDEELDTK